MWTTQRRDRRTRRRAGLQLEYLDDRLVLSAGAGAAAGAAAVDHHHPHHHHHHHHHAAMAAHRAMPPMTSAMSAIVLSSSGSAGASGGRVSVSASGHTVGRITVTPIGSGWHPGSAGPQFQMTPIATGGDTGGSSSTTTTGSNTGSGGTTTPSPPPQTGHLPGHFLLGPDGQPAAIVF